MFLYRILYNPGKLLNLLAPLDLLLDPIKQIFYLADRSTLSSKAYSDEDLYCQYMLYRGEQLGGIYNTYIYSRMIV